MKSLSTLEKILQDNRQDPMQSYKILQEFYGILISFGKDPIKPWDGHGIVDKHERTPQHS